MRFGVSAAILASLVAGCTSDGGRTADFIEVPGLGATRVDVPRPAGAGSLACDDDPLPPESDATVEDRVAALRAIGLFADRSGLSDTALASEIEAALVDIWGEVPSGSATMDLIVAELDRTRVWWRDLEADVVDGNDAYAQTLAEWGEISVGVFEPMDIAESWAGDEGPITVTFTLGSETRTLHPEYYDDFLDPGIIVDINDAIGGAERRFEMYKAFDQTALVMALTAEEKRALEGRGWCFE